jgi:hypothetical protein
MTLISVKPPLIQLTLISPAPGVHCVVQELPEDGGRTVDDFTSGDFPGDPVREKGNGAAFWHTLKCTEILIKVS